MGYTTRTEGHIELRTPNFNKNLNAEIQIALQLRKSQTPLLGGEGPDFELLKKSNFQSSTPFSTQQETPNILISRYNSQDIIRVDGSTPDSLITSEMSNISGNQTPIGDKL